MQEARKLHGLPFSGDEWFVLAPDDPFRWQPTSIMDAAVSVGTHPHNVHRWMRDGTLSTPETWQAVRRDPESPRVNHYLIDMRHLRAVVLMTRGERKKLRGFVSQAGKKYEFVKQLKEDWWEPGTKMVLSQNEVARLMNLSMETVHYMLESGYLYAPLDYRLVLGPRGETLKEWDLDQLHLTVSGWKRSHPARRGLSGGGSRPSKRQRDLDVVKEFEQGYVPPSERIDRSDEWAIGIQERAEKQTALLLGNRRASARPYSVPVQNRRTRKPKKAKAPASSA